MFHCSGKGSSFHYRPKWYKRAVKTKSGDRGSSKQLQGGFLVTSSKVQSIVKFHEFVVITRKSRTISEGCMELNLCRLKIYIHS